MLDASSTVSSGVLKGNFIDLGTFDECVDVHEVEDEGMRGSHCTYTIGFKMPQKAELPVHPTMSICLPTSCGKDDVMSLLHETIQRNESMRQELKVLSTSCTSGELRVKDMSFWVSL